jgi:hypothetical protein
MNDRRIEMKKLIFLVMVVGLAIPLFAQNDEYHHIFPQEFGPDFKELGIDIDNFTIKLPRSEHRTHHGTYNADWGDFLEKNKSRLLSLPQASREKELLKHAEQSLSNIQNIRGKFDFYKYTSGSKPRSNVKLAGNGAALTVGSGGFLTFCAKIGRFFYNIGGGIIALLINLGIFVAGLFGIHLGAEDSAIALIIGIVAVVLAVFAAIGLFFFIKWLMGLLLVGAGVSGKFAMGGD